MHVIVYGSESYFRWSIVTDREFTVATSDRFPTRAGCIRAAKAAIKSIVGRPVEFYAVDSLAGPAFGWK